MGAYDDLFAEKLDLFLKLRLIGDPATGAAKMRHVDDVLGGMSRITFQMSTALLETAAKKRSIETPARSRTGRYCFEEPGRRGERIRL
jgi:hypothetical protein